MFVSENLDGPLHLLHVVGARPNFMKAAPVIAACDRHGVRQTLVHSGQHYDANMSEVFFQQLGMRSPDVNLGVGSGTHASQTAEIMARFEPVLQDYKPDLVVVYGDVNSTLAAALVSSKLQVRVAHVEAGLRSFDRTMPEEINRIVVDQLAELLFTPSADAGTNLLREGIPADKIHFVGNVMIDTLKRLLPCCVDHQLADIPCPYALITLHRPSNVDDPAWLRDMLLTLAEFSRDLTVVFPVHPRTRRRVDELAMPSLNNVRLLDPLPYLDFLALQRSATVVITDSGGIQEETTALNVPCITVRENTERPITIERGTNVLAGRNLLRLRSELRRILDGQTKQAQPIPFWDGNAADRIADVVLQSRSACAQSALVHA